MRTMLNLLDVEDGEQAWIRTVVAVVYDLEGRRICGTCRGGCWCCIVLTDRLGPWMHSH